MTDLATSGQSTKPSRAELDRELERYRTELTGYCYRMMGSAFEAEDAVQETMIRAWRAYDRFEGRSSLRSWLYRIATNVCYDALKGRKRRAVPMDFGPASTADSTLAPPLPESTWVEPAPDGRVLPERDDPADVAVSRESIRLAFVAALQHLPPRQRAVLILREVLRWRASEVAALLETSEASVNSALQRARATFSKIQEEHGTTSDVDTDHAVLLARYVEAFEQYDMETLVSLLHEDATQTMPPFDLWLRGRDQIVAWMLGPGAACRNSKLVPIQVNGVAGFGQYKPSATGDGYEPWAIHVHDIVDGRFQGLNFFLDTERLFPLFGLPLHLDG